jgi:hypothetical protein
MLAAMLADIEHTEWRWSRGKKKRQRSLKG